MTFFRNPVTMLWKKVKEMFTTEDDTRNSNMNMPDYKGKFPIINAVTYGIEWSAEGLETCKRMQDRRLEITTRNDLKPMEELYVGDGRNVHLTNISPGNYSIVLGEHNLKPVKDRIQSTDRLIHIGSPDSVWLTPDWISDGVIIKTDNTPLGFSVGLPMTTFGPLIGTIHEKIFDIQVTMENGYIWLRASPDEDFLGWYKKNGGHPTMTESTLRFALITGTFSSGVLVNDLSAHILRAKSSSIVAISRHPHTGS